MAASLLASKPGLLVAGLALMCAAMFARAIAWHAILVAAPTWRRAKRRDAMQGTFIGVLMSSTLPARLGEPSRALIVARRLGRARETLPVVLGTMVSQTLLNLLALAILGGVTLSSVSVLDGHDRALLLIALAPLAVLLAVAARARPDPARRGLALAPPAGAAGRHAPLAAAPARRPARLSPAAPGGGCDRRPAGRLDASVAVLLAAADGARPGRPDAGAAAAAGVLFAVNVTAVVPATPANVGVFQAACVAVLAGAYHVSTPDAIAYGIVLQAVEVATALIMGCPRCSTRASPGATCACARCTPRRCGSGRCRPAAVGGARGSRRLSGSRGRHRSRWRCAPCSAAYRAAMADAWVYMLRCADGSLYTGWSTDVARRLARHRAGKASRYTASRLPVELAFAAAMADRTAARREEARIKALDRAGEARADRRRPAWPSACRPPVGGAGVGRSVRA